MEWIKKITILILAITVISCEKQQDFIKNTQRIKEVVFKDDGQPIRKIEFIYNNEDISEVIYNYKTSDGWAPESKSIFYFEDNSFIHEEYFIKGDNYKYLHKNIFKIHDHRIVEDAYFIGSFNEWYPNVTWTYNYEGDQLLGFNSIHIKDDVWVERGVANYVYSNNEVAEHFYYEKIDGEVLEMDRDTFIWQDGKIIQFTDYNRRNGQLVLNSYSDYFYEGDKVSQIDLYAHRNGEWRHYNTITYRYDASGYLIHERVNWGMERLYVYEPGHGNFGTVHFMPEDMIFKQPMFKNSENLEEEDPDLAEQNFVFNLLFRNAASGL